MRTRGRSSVCCGVGAEGSGRLQILAAAAAGGGFEVSLPSLSSESSSLGERLSMSPLWLRVI